MKSRPGRPVYCIFLALAAPLLLAGEGEKSGGPPPLKLDRDAPLLLLEDKPAEAPQQTPAGKGKAADNSVCFVCHENYDGEEMAAMHAVEGVGCMKCHGESTAHAEDEGNVTPPDTMYSRGDVDAACGDCHESHDVPAREVLALARKRGLQARSLVFCTDCHGTHRLEKRSVRWDRKTRKLIEE